jgi:hypothetical protein
MAAAARAAAVVAGIGAPRARHRGTSERRCDGACGRYRRLRDRFVFLSRLKPLLQKPHRSLL